MDYNYYFRQILNETEFNWFLFRQLLLQFLFKGEKKERKKSLRHRLDKISIRGKNIHFFFFFKLED